MERKQDSVANRITASRRFKLKEGYWVQERTGFWLGCEYRPDVCVMWFYTLTDAQSPAPRCCVYM
jgi:hypothetical protein